MSTDLDVEAARAPRPERLRPICEPRDESRRFWYECHKREERYFDHNTRKPRGYTGMSTAAEGEMLRQAGTLRIELVRGAIDRFVAIG